MLIKKLFSCFPWGKGILKESNGTFCALHHWLYFTLCHTTCPQSSFALSLAHSTAFVPNLFLFLTLCVFISAASFAVYLSNCLSLSLSLCLSLCLSGAVMSIHSRAQRFEVLPNGTLVIQNVQLQDRGTYICNAQSFLGRDRWDYCDLLWILMRYILSYSVLTTMGPNISRLDFWSLRHAAV